MKNLTIKVESISWAEVAKEEGLDTRHFDTVCRELGITYEKMKGIAIAGCVYLYNCHIPEGTVLPKYYEIGVDDFIIKQYFL